MNLDKFMNSQTFKTGTFVLLVLLVLLIVFKIGFIHGYKKAISPHKYGNNYSQIYGGTFSDHYKGTASKDMREKFLLKMKFITDKESVEEDITQ